VQAVWSTPERKNSHGVALLCLADRTERPSSSLYSSCRHHRNSGVPVLFGAYKPRQHLVHPRTAYTPSTVDVAFATIELALLERARLAPPRESLPVMALATPFTFVLGHLVPAGYGSPAGGELLGVRCGDDHVTASCGVRGGRTLRSTWSVAAARLFMPVKFVLLLSYLLHTVSGLYFCARGAGG